MKFSDERILSLHREVVATPSVSGQEGPLADLLAAFLTRCGAPVTRLGNSLLSILGSGPLLLLDTHLDTVPPAPGWTGDPWTPRHEAGRVVGLGSNDAKASVVAMTAAFLAFVEADLPFSLGLALVEEEETRGTGTVRVLEQLARDGRTPVATVIGEPTGLDLAVAQKGLLVLELSAHGDSCHAAHAATLGARNAVRELARGLVSLESVDLGPAHPSLGLATLEPTRLSGGTANNVIPGEAKAVLDVRTTPVLGAEELVARVEVKVLAAAPGCAVRVVSDRLRPMEIPLASPLVAAARLARPEARLYGSATLSDMALLGDIPALKCGPGDSERSHRPDEYVTEAEVLGGFDFYVRLIRAWAEDAVKIAARAAAREAAA